MVTVFAATATAVAAFMFITWLVSLARHDASIVDIAWGAGFVLVAWVAFAAGDGYGPRQWLITLMVTAWGLRLSFYLAWRNLGKGEDYRYQAMRRRWGDRFPIISLVTVFALQGLLMLVVSLPVQAAHAWDTPRNLTVLDLAGAAVWAAGLFFEATGDWQLARFKTDPANAGKVMDRGLWRYTRHPNYFGDFLVWWGIFLVTLSRWESAWTIVGPAAMSYLLLRVSGVTLLERSLVKRRPGYEEYIARTSAFFPRPPKRT